MSTLRVRYGYIEGTCFGCGCRRYGDDFVVRIMFCCMMCCNMA